MYFLLKLVIFQPAMLVYQRVALENRPNPKRKVIHLPSIVFQGQAVKFSGGVEGTVVRIIVLIQGVL